MGFSASSQTIAEEKPVNIYLRQLLGSYELVFHFTGGVHPQMPEPKWLHVHSARIAVQTARGKQELGTAYPRMPAEIRQRQHPGHFNIELFLILSSHQLTALEDWRDAGDLTFEISTASVGGRIGVDEEMPEFQAFYGAVEESAWIKQLKSAAFADILLLEVPMPVLGASQRERAIANHLTRAQQHFLEGNYPDCVTECRKAAEELEQGTSPDWSLLQTRQSREDMTKEQRERFVLASLKQYAHPSAHSASQGGWSDYTRADARLALAVLAALAAH